MLSKEKRKTLRSSRKQLLHCTVCGGDHTFRTCPVDETSRVESYSQKGQRVSSKSYYERLAGGGVLPRARSILTSCDCRRGRILVDMKTNREVGFQRFFYDAEEESYFLDGRRLNWEEVKRIDWSTTSQYHLDPAYIGPDGRTRGVIGSYEYCDCCERRQKAKIGAATIRWWIRSPSGYRRYFFVFGPDAPSEHLDAFVRFRQHFPRSTQKEWRDFLLCCLLYFSKYASIPTCSERALARRFRIKRGLIRRIRLRYRHLLLQPAVQS